MTTPSPEPAPAEPEVGVGMDKGEIREVIREHLAQIRACFEKELKNTPDLHGKLILEWDIGDLGKVEAVRVKKSLKPSMDECIAGVIKSSLFPTPPKDQIGRVVYPFMFSVQ